MTTKTTTNHGRPTIEYDAIRRLFLEAGADDVGCIEIDRAEIADQRDDILAAFPCTKTLISLVCRMNRENIRTPMRSIANLEFHHTGDDVNDVARRGIRAFEKMGIRAINGGAMGFPMEADRWPNKIWVVSHKPIAVAAGLGQMGIHRNVIHPKFGNHILLGTVLLDAEVTAYSRPINYNPCLKCKLCVAACPTGAISPEGAFNFSACYTHNYREFMGGFVGWVETVADSTSGREYRKKVSDAETVSMWQSLGFGPNYKAAYCLSVCPAGDEVIGPYRENKALYADTVVHPLQNKKETVYVVPGSDAERYVPRRFPHKTTRRVASGLRPTSIASFLFGLTLTFQPGQSEGLNAVYHFTFTGEEEREATVVIRQKRLEVLDGHVGTADFRLNADSRTWVQFVRKDANLAWAILRRRIRFRGSPRLLLAFGRCFPA